ncbi:MAG: DNA polymerase IV [Dehalococcoidia bacterium]|nr:DNA polymerase IV [Dehalococcoidia bacterium]
MSAPVLPRRIAHFDLDTFFVAVERLDDPLLIGKPVLVGFNGPRGVVASASYESRTFGCHSAMPMSMALRLCPQAVVVAPHFDRYIELSRGFHARLAEAVPIVESVGIDEAYADLTGLEPHGGANSVATALRVRVRRDLGIAVSVCIAGSRITAKVGSDRAKPDGLIEVPVGEDATFLAPFGIRELPLVGPKMGERLAAAGITTIGQAAEVDPRWLEDRFGKAGALLHERARGLDPTAVHHGGRDARSISREMTFGVDVEDVEKLRRVLHSEADRVGADLRDSGKRARTVMLKLRWSDFTTFTRARTFEQPAQATSELHREACVLLDELLAAQGMQPVRLIGLGVRNLVDDAVQLRFDDAPVRRHEALDHAIDALRGRFGDASVVRGHTGSRSRGLRDSR